MEIIHISDLLVKKASSRGPFFVVKRGNMCYDECKENVMENVKVFLNEAIYLMQARGNFDDKDLKAIEIICNKLELSYIEKENGEFDVFDSPK